MSQNSFMRTRATNCKQCNANLPKIGHGRLCRPCVRQKRREEYHGEDKEKIRLRQKAYIKENIVKICQKNMARKRLVAQSKPMLDSFYQARSRSKKNGIPFSIKYDDIPEPPVFCPVLGIKLTYNTGSRSETSPSLDKVIPSLGYIPGNVQIISFRANAIKGNASLEEIEKVANYLRTHIENGK